MHAKIDHLSANENSPLHALYYPFSRCMDGCALKQLLLVFEGITFLEPVENSWWRAKLFRDLEKTEDPRFSAFRHLQAPLDELQNEGVIVHVKPKDLDAFSRPETSVAALSDLNDSIWCDIASKPKNFGLPHQSRAENGLPTWQIFPSKLPHAFRQELSGGSLSRHLIEKYDENSAWTLSYEAGSAASLNLHLAAAGDLGLAPVTDSAMHHRLLLRKIMRSSTPDSQWTEPVSMQTQVIANNAALNLIDSLIPRQALQQISFDSILRFREATRTDRMALIAELNNSLSSIASLSSLSEVRSKQDDLRRAISKEVREYQASIASVRDKLWPTLVRVAGTTGLVGGSAVAIVYEYLFGGPLGVLAASIGGSALAALQSGLELRGEKQKVERQARPSIAYLSKVADLKQ